MKQDFELQLQAWVDGELQGSAARKVETRMAKDAEAAELARALRGLKQAIATGEFPLTVPETREFYWGKIERAIRQAPPAPRPLAWTWRRWLMPIAGAAVIAAAFMILRQETRPPTYDEIASTEDGMEAVTFHDQVADMTVVWLQDRTPVAETLPASTHTAIPDPGESTIEIE